MKEKPIVAVLMSTYNGEKYLEEQINSILSQKDVDIHLYIRDDGSSDGTLALIQQFTSKYDNVFLLSSRENINYAKSFLTLLCEVGDADYYAFSDQDDIWKEDKLISGIKLLQADDCSEKCIYVCAMEYVDSQKNFLFYRGFNGRNDTFGSYLSRGSIPGCVMIFSKEFVETIRPFCRQILSEHDWIYGHDKWLNLLCAGIGGHVVVDNNAYICYRRHENTATVSARGIRKRIAFELQELWNEKNSRMKALQFICTYGEGLFTEDILAFCKFALQYRDSIKVKWYLLFSPAIKTGSKLIDMKYCVGVILNRY